MKKSLVFLLVLISFISQLKGQDSISTLDIQVQEAIVGDTISLIGNEQIKIDKKLTEVKFKPDPTRAVIYSAIFPGLGQIYNRKYWKLPIIYGGFIGLSYGMTWNGRYYDDYSSAYRAIMADDPRSTFEDWRGMISRWQIQDANDLSDAEIERIRSQFRRKKNYYRRNRDLCVIAAVGVYLVCMVDAYVDAQLFDFDISPDLSLRVEPMVSQSPLGTSFSGKSLGVQCSIKF